MRRIGISFIFPLAFHRVETGDQHEKIPETSSGAFYFYLSSIRVFRFISSAYLYRYPLV